MWNSEMYVSGKEGQKGKERKEREEGLWNPKRKLPSPKRIQLKGRNEQQYLDLSTELLTVKSCV